MRMRVSEARRWTLNGKAVSLSQSIWQGRLPAEAFCISCPGTAERTHPSRIVAGGFEQVSVTLFSLHFATKKPPGGQINDPSP